MSQHTGHFRVGMILFTVIMAIAMPDNVKRAGISAIVDLVPFRQHLQRAEQVRIRRGYLIYQQDIVFHESSSASVTSAFHPSALQHLFQPADLHFGDG